jgi:hypothetical protein
MAPVNLKKAIVGEKRDVWTDKETNVLVDNLILKKVCRLSPFTDVFRVKSS